MTTTAWNATLRRASARIKNSMRHVPQADQTDALYEAVALWLTRNLSSAATPLPSQEGATHLSVQGSLSFRVTGVLSQPNSRLSWGATPNSLSLNTTPGSSHGLATKVLSHQDSSLSCGVSSDDLSLNSTPGSLPGHALQDSQLLASERDMPDPAPWLALVARRLLINRWKVARREILFSSFSNTNNDDDDSNCCEFDSGEDCALSWDIQHDYARALTAMSTSLRECFLLYQDGYSIQEIAVQLGLSPEAAKKRTQRARSFMQHYLHEYAS